jgi:hypothetical protein
MLSPEERALALHMADKLPRFMRSAKWPSVTATWFAYANSNLRSMRRSRRGRRFYKAANASFARRTPTRPCFLACGDGRGPIMGGQPGKPKPPGNPPNYPDEGDDEDTLPPINEPAMPIPIPPVERPPAPMR